MAIDILSAFEQEPQPIDFVLPGMVAGSVGAVVSPGGAGKSMLALQIAATLTGGPDLLEFGALPRGPVVYLPAEDPPPSIEHRLYHLGQRVAPHERERVAQGMHIEPLVGRQPNIINPRWTDYLLRVCEGSRLLILDTLRRFHLSEENDSGAMSEVIGRLEHIAQETGCSVIFLHHSSKAAALGGQGDQQQASRGSSVLVDNIRWQSYLAGMTAAEAEKRGVDEEMRGHFVRFGVSKVNYGPPIAEKWLRRTDGGVLVPAVLERRKSSNSKEVRRDGPAY